MPFTCLTHCYPLLLPSLFPSIRVFSNESVHHIRWPKDWSLNFSISPSNAYSGLVSFTIDWFDLLAVQGNLKSLLQHHNSNAPVLRCSAFFMVQLSQPYMTTGKTIAWTRWTFVGKVMSLIFNMLSRFVIAFLPMRNLQHLNNCIILHSYQQCMSIVTLSSCQYLMLSVLLILAILANLFPSPNPGSLCCNRFFIWYLSCLLR